MQVIKPRVLLVEDDANLGFVVKDNLEAKGYTVVHCTDGKTSFETFMKDQFDICLLDVMLPRMDGFELAEKIRLKNKHVPIIFLSAKSMLEDKITGFKIGADDYITKPFSMEELFFKIEVFLRRSSLFNTIKPGKEIIKIGQYTFDFANLALSHAAEEISLTLREGEVLQLLSAEVNNIVARETILTQIWGKDDYFLGRSLDVFISRLRKYLKHDSAITIENVHSVGFRLSVKS